MNDAAEDGRHTASSGLGAGPTAVAATGQVFISYAHDDAVHEDRVSQFWRFLRDQGVDAKLDLAAAEQRQDWAQWMTQQVRDADRVLVIASPEYKRRAEGDAGPDEGRGVQWEARLIRDRFYAEQQAGLAQIIPVVLPGRSAADIPFWLGPASTTHYLVSEYTVAGAERLLRLLTGQPAEIEPPLGAMPVLPPRGAQAAGAGVDGPSLAGASSADSVRLWSCVLPERPRALTERSEEMAALRQALLAGAGHPVVVAGMGGSGKSVLAAQVARAVRDGSDLELSEIYPAGVAWATVGRGRPIAMVQAELARDFGGDLPDPGGDWRSGRARLQQLAVGKRGLVVLDDVWAQERYEPFRLDVPGVQVLVTTRNQNLAGELGGAQVLVETLDPEQARMLLARLADVPVEGLPEEAGQILAEVGHLALGVAMVGGMAGQYGLEAWPDLLRRLQERRLDEIAQRFPDNYEHATLRPAVEVAVEDLDSADQQRWAELAVFAGEAGVPESAIAALWQPFDADRLASRERIGRFLARSLMQGGDGRYRLHDLQNDVAGLRLGDDLPATHGRLADVFAGRVAAVAAVPERAGWAELADALTRLPSEAGWRPIVSEYLLDHLAYHLSGAGRDGDLGALLTDVAWIQVRLICGQLTGLIGDYGYVEDHYLAQQILRALRLSAHAVTGDPGLVRGQLAARLSPHPSAEVSAWVADLITRPAAAPWLMARTAALTPVTTALEQTLTGHHGRVSAVAITSDGQQVVSGGYDESVRIWDLGAGTEIQTLEGSGQVQSIALLPGGCVAIGRHDTIEIWNPSTGDRRQLFDGGAGAIRSLAATPDGASLLAATQSGGLLIWQLSTNSSPRILSDRLQPRVIALSPDGSRVIIGSPGGIVTALDVHTGNQVWQWGGHVGSVRSAAVSPDGKSVVTVGAHGPVKIWNLGTGAPPTGFDAEMALRTVAITPSGRIITGGTDGSLKIWDPHSPVVQLRGPLRGTGDVLSMAVSPDGTRLVSSGDNDGSVRVWNLAATATPQAPDNHVPGHEDLRDLAVTPDGKLLSSSGDGVIHVWDPQTGLRRQLPGVCRCSIEVLAITPDGQGVLTVSGAGHIRLRDLETGAERWAAQAKPSNEVSVAVTPDGTRTVTATGGDVPGSNVISVWDLATGKIERAWTTQLGITSLAITPDGRNLLSAGQDSSVRIWDLDTGKEQHLLTQGTSDCGLVTVSPDGQRIVTAGFGGYGFGAGVRIWDWAGRTPFQAIDGHVGTVRSVTVSADGAYLVTAGADAFLHVWELASGERVASWKGDHPMRSCAVFPAEVLQIAVLEEHGHPYLLELRDTGLDVSRS